MASEWPQIGDALEVRFKQHPDVSDADVWLPATVCHADHYQISVAFSDGQRLALQRNSGRGLYRKPHRRKGDDDGR